VVYREIDLPLRNYGSVLRLNRNPLIQRDLRMLYPKLLWTGAMEDVNRYEEQWNNDSQSKRYKFVLGQMSIHGSTLHVGRLSTHEPSTNVLFFVYTCKTI
jgi:hypothetical protein